jgi:hypothetical protein
MTELDPIQAYLIELTRLLPRRNWRTKRALEEIETHLYESAERLTREGMQPAAAAVDAVGRFGTPREVIERFELEAPFESEVEAMLRYCLMPTAVLSFLFGAVLMVTAWFDETRHDLFVFKLVIAATMMVCSVVLFHQGWATRPPRNWQRGLALAAALASIMIGSAGSVFTAHLRFVTHDWQMYGFVAAGLLILQGVLAVIGPVMDNSSLKPTA